MHNYKDARDAATVTDGGTVSGYASTFDRDPDAYGDIVAKGAFADSIKRWEKVGKPIPLLYGHNTEDPEYNIGKVLHIEEDERGLYIEAEFDADNPKAQYVRKLVKEGRLYQFSFAFDILDQCEIKLEDGRKANELCKLDIFEVSLVQIPANQHAEVTDVKEDRLAQVRKFAETMEKSGRRNSKADEDELKRIADSAQQIIEVVNGLIDEVEKPEEEDEQANAEEPKANAEEQRADFSGLVDEAEKLLKYIKE
ncbi:MAG: HK97 family phage prohead protease [Eggerthellaceae bacterium]|nr:HK97 family phage prohead protease [Eggerthellaceae bacterium]